MENDDKTHPCALLKGEGASMNYCRTFTRFPQKNLEGCCASKCRSPGRICYVCLRDSIRPPVTLVDGVCRVHGKVGGLTPEEIVKVPPAALRKFSDPEALLREQKRARRSLLEQGRFSEGVRELNGVEKTPPSAPQPSKPATLPVFFTPVPTPVDLSLSMLQEEEKNQIRSALEELIRMAQLRAKPRSSWESIVRDFHVATKKSSKFWSDFLNPMEVSNALEEMVEKLSMSEKEASVRFRRNGLWAAEMLYLQELIPQLGALMGPHAPREWRLSIKDGLYLSSLDRELQMEEAVNALVKRRAKERARRTPRSSQK